MLSRLREPMTEVVPTMICMNYICMQNISMRNISKIRSYLDSTML